jgi:hypothetical protein
MEMPTATATPTIITPNVSRRICWVPIYGLLFKND